MPVGHTFPQPPQLLLSVSVLVQVPVAPPQRVGVPVGQQRPNPAY
jgi:hypothetical protein